MSFDNEQFEQIKKAVEVEVKNQFIDIRGKQKSFSRFIIDQIKLIYKKSDKNPKWLVLSEAFERYPQETMLSRKKTIEKFVKAIKEEMQSSSNVYVKNEDIFSKPVMYLKGVGPKIAYLLNKLDISTIFDLIYFFPRKYLDYSSKVDISKLKEGENATIIGKIIQTGSYTTKNNLTIVKVVIGDKTGKLILNFFYNKANKYLQNHYRSQFMKDNKIIVSGIGKIDSYTKQMTLDKIQYEILNADVNEPESVNLGRIVPVYPLIEGLNIKTLRKAVLNALNEYENTLEDVIPFYLQEKYGLFTRKEAIRQIHFPNSLSNAQKARYTLVFEELFVMQTQIALSKELYEKEVEAQPIKLKKGGLVEKFINSLPFELTNAQKTAVDVLLKDLNSTKPMQRLLQGDVGSGKTVVACIMLLCAIENGFQSAIMAPTEILAQQHYNNFIKWLTPLGVSVGLFIGSNRFKQRKNIETDLRSGQINLAIGTHALIQANVEFKNLGAVVIDEQHRFGVRQRNELRLKGEMPQVLSMSATPIPRSLALTTHADLDLTIIDELPKGRKKIKTALLTSSQRKQAYNLIRNQVSEGHQAYIVYPLIDESETISAKAATIEWQKLKEGEFSDFKVGLLHGKMKNQEKEDVMQRFKNKEFDILVCTTVVEVGVDVENATVMVIEDAQRFGLSQLHQLRGRVGRNELQSFCILISNSSSQETKTRLEILTRTNDGFIIAQKDLEIRGPGEFLGTKQSGINQLSLTDLIKDIEVIEITKNEVRNYIKTDDIHKNSELQKLLEYRSKSNIDFSKLD